MASEEVVTLANAIAKLPFWGELDCEALLAAIKEKWPGKEALTKPALKEIFLQLNYDKIKVEEAAEGAGGEEEGGEEGGEAKPPAEPPKQEISQHAEATFELLLQHLKAAGRAKAPEGEAAEQELEVKEFMSTLFICKNGYGEPAFKFAVKLVDKEGQNALLEADLWFAITRTAINPPDAVVRNHLRKAVSAGCGGEGQEVKLVNVACSIITTPFSSPIFLFPFPFAVARSREAALP